MAFTVSSNLATILDTASTKVDWSNKVIAALGATRTVRCFWDANASAPDPASTGTEFLNISASGGMTVIGGNIVGLGSLSSFTIHNSVDLSTGAAVLRIEGGGYWIQGTLGLINASKDFTISANLTTTAGVMFDPSAGCKPPALLDSGTGPLSPTLTANAPYSVTIEDWSSGNAVVVGTIVFDTRIENWVFDDSEIAENMGDVKCYQSSTSVTFGEFNFGAIMFAKTATLNPNTTTEPVYEVLVGYAPTASNWPNYPAFSGYVFGGSSTFSKPFKAVIKTQSGSILYIHQMSDNLPINSPNLHDDDVTNYPLRPFLHCGALLPWESVRAKNNTYSAKWMPGYTSDGNRAGVARTHFSCNNAEPLVNHRGNTNSLKHFYAVPKWPFAGNTTAQSADTPSADPKLFNFSNYLPYPYGTSTTGVFRATGWGYEPGALGIIDTLTGPGGPRHDRATYPTPFLIWKTEPTWLRPRGGESIQDIIDNWKMQFFNLPFHMLTDVKTFSTVDTTEVFTGKWGHGRTYYAGYDTYVNGGLAKTIPLFAVGQGDASDSTKPHQGMFVDKNNRLPWNGAAVDYLHNYTTPFYVATHMNSAMHMLATKHRVLHAIMAQLTNSDGYGDPRNTFMTRLYAWKFQHLVQAWKISSDHPAYGIPRKIVHERVVRELEAIYDFVYKPAMLDNNMTDPFLVSIRNLGVPITLDTNGKTWSASGMGLMFYMGSVFHLMRQTGFYSYYRDYSDKCKQALWLMMRCMDMQSIEYILETDGWREFYGNVGKAGTNTTTVPIQVCDNWADLHANNPKQSSLNDWLHDKNGTMYGTPGAINIVGGSATAAHEQDANQHIRFQWVCIHRDYFPEVPSTRTDGVNLAYTKFKGYYDQIDAGLADNSLSDWTWRWPTHAQFLPPTVTVP